MASTAYVNLLGQVARDFPNAYCVSVDRSMNGIFNVMVSSVSFVSSRLVELVRFSSPRVREGGWENVHVRFGFSWKATRAARCGSRSGSVQHNEYSCDCPAI